jgi:integral membrane protein
MEDLAARARTMRYIALAEATSFILLLAASVVKRSGGTELGVHVLGPIHGLLFIAYVAYAFNVRSDLGWSGRTTFWVLVGAVVPFGGYVVDRWLLRDPGGDAARSQAR